MQSWKRLYISKIAETFKGLWLISKTAFPLSAITSGYHFHHISAESPEVLDEIVEALDQKGFLAEFTPYERGEEGEE